MFPSSPKVIYTLMPKSSFSILNKHFNTYSPFSLSTASSPELPSSSSYDADETLEVFIALPEPV